MPEPQVRRTNRLSVEPVRSQSLKAKYPWRSIVITADSPTTSVALSSSSDSRFSWPPSRSSASSRTSTSSWAPSPDYETVPTLTKTPWELQRSRRPLSAWSQSSRNSSRRDLLPARIFRDLPDEVYDCVLQHLDALHASPISTSCASCHLKDLTSLAQTSQAWQKATRGHLYGSIWVPSNESMQQLRRLRVKTISRLKLLRRTLRERPELAQHVRELKVSVDLRHELQRNTKDKEDPADILASIIMACPNLERLTGFYPPYAYDSDRLIYALSTRKNLKEHVWIVSNSQPTIRPTSNDSTIFYEPSLDRIKTFLHYHNDWRSLDTLLLHAQQSGSIESGTIYGIIRKLPSLKHLMVSGFAPHEFHDCTLQALPALHSLRLQDLHGITDHGIAQLVHTRAASSLQHLSLIDLEITSLPSLSALLASLTHLRRFTLVQDASPCTPPGATMPQPALSSPTLRYLHWDVLIPGPSTDPLAASIQRAGFPALTTLRAPSDHDGVLQDICRPLATAAIPSDCAASPSAPLPTSATHYVRSLKAARRAAQVRIEQARRRPALKVVVEDEGEVVHKHTLRSFMGTVGSNVEYVLEPDVEGSDDAVMGIRNLLKGTGTVVGEVCVGAGGGGGEGSGKKGGHAARRREGVLELQKFF